MKKSHHSVVRLTIVTFLLVTLAACSGAPAPEATDPAYQAEIEEWRAERLARLTADDGWLTLSGLYWLEPGRNTFGSAPGNTVVVPDPTVPGEAGILALGDDGDVIVSVPDGSSVTINGEALGTERLKTDADGKPDVIFAGRAQFYIIKRGDKLGARVKDPEAPTRLAFAGIDHFPINPAYRVEATLEPYDELREVAIPTVLGQDSTMLAPGVLRFTLNGTEMTLEPYVGSADAESYFLIFRDGTSAVTTYGAGRFLSADAAKDGTTTLDFNLAYNPPCAFTPYATCPLPPPQNWLSAPIEAGEKYSGEAH
jgi:uncharacterized protein (DUF1684 family)